MVIKNRKLGPSPALRIKRFEEMAFGLFLHWGLYSKMGKGEWVMLMERIPAIEYEKIARSFTASKFDPDLNASIARDAGMKYMVLTTRHHDGFSLYDTRGLNTYDAPHAACQCDLVEKFADGCRKKGIAPFFYHTTLDWHFGGFKTRDCTNEQFREYIDYLYESIKILCTQYGEVGGFWFDGNWSRRGADWQEDRLYAMIRQYQPEAMIINNSGMQRPGESGHPELDTVTFEQHAPKTLDRRDHSKYVAGEMCQTINRHWGIGSLDFQYKSVSDIIDFLCQCRKVGSNYLLNVGPDGEGAIPPLEEAMLRKIGDWMKIYANAIYAGRPDIIEATGEDFVLRNGKTLYYFAKNINGHGHPDVSLNPGGNSPRSMFNISEPIKYARWMDNGERLDVLQDLENNFAAINCTGYPYGQNHVLRVAEITLI